MINIKSLTFSGIGRFIEEQTINFDGLGSLTQVEGKIIGSDRSSGAGKSTIFKALNWLLGLDGPPTTILQSRFTKNSIKVSGLFEWNGIPIKIERSKKLSIELPNETISGSSKITEEKLDEILAMPRTLFSKVLHKQQGERGWFLKMGPTDVHKFLTTCLGLEKEQAKILTLETRLNTLLESQTSIKSAIQSSQMGLEATQNAISSLGPYPVLEIAPGALEALKNAHLEAVNNHNLIKEAHTRELNDLEATRPVFTTTPFDRSRIVQLDKELGMIIVEIAKLEKVESDRQSQVKSKISELQIQINNLNNKELTRQSEVKNQISAIQVQISKLQSAEQTRQSTVKSQISSLQIELIKANSIINLGVKAKEEAVALAKELAIVRSSVCPTCNQGWVTEACKAKEAQILAKLSEHKKTVIAGNEAQNKITSINEQIQTLNLEVQPKAISEINVLNESISRLKLDTQPNMVPEIGVINLSITQLKASEQPQVIPEVIELKMKSDFKSKELAALWKEESDHQFKETTKQQLMVVNFAQKQTALRKEHENTIKFVRDNESNAFYAHESAKNQIKFFEESKKKFENSSNVLTIQLNTYTIQLQNKSSELALAEEEIELATESKKAIKSYLSCSFEDALDSIGDMATKLIRSIPNMETSTIQFEGLKETKEGRVKEEVNCTISMDGDISIPIRCLSGGEESAVDIGVDLSVIEFIGERTGTGTNVFILDEFTTGLDTICIENAIEMLKTFSINKKILLIEHNPVAAQSIESKLTVIRDGLTSRIVQQ